MSEKVGLVSFPDLKSGGKSPFSRTLKNLIDLEARKLIGEAYFRTEKLLRDNQDKLVLVIYTCCSTAKTGDRVLWRTLREAYVQQWTAIG